MKTHRRILLISAIVLVVFGVGVVGGTFFFVRPRLISEADRFAHEYYSAGKTVQALELYEEACKLKCLVADLLVSYYGVVGVAAIGLGLMINMALLDTRQKSPESDS